MLISQKDVIELIMNVCGFTTARQCAEWTYINESTISRIRGSKTKSSADCETFSSRLCNEFDVEVILRKMREYLAENALLIDEIRTNEEILSLGIGGIEEFIVKGWERSSVSAYGDNAGQTNVNENNVFLSSRLKINGEISLEERLEGAKTISLLNFAATTFLHESTIAPYDSNAVSERTLFERLLDKGTSVRIVLPKEGSLSERDAYKYKMLDIYEVFDENGVCSTKAQDVIRIMRERLVRDVKKYNTLHIRFTEVCMPYGLMIVTYPKSVTRTNPDKRNHVKVDLYSPFLRKDRDRRSFVVYEGDTEGNYEFFVANFNEFWNDPRGNDKVAADVSTVFGDDV